MLRKAIGGTAALAILGGALLGVSWLYMSVWNAAAGLFGLPAIGLELGAAFCVLLSIALWRWSR